MKIQLSGNEGKSDVSFVIGLVIVGGFILVALALIAILCIYTNKKRSFDVPDTIVTQSSDNEQAKNADSEPSLITKQPQE